MKNRYLEKDAHIRANKRREERKGRERKEEEEEGICSSGANYVNENGERIASVQ